MTRPNLRQGFLALAVIAALAVAGCSSGSQAGPQGISAASAAAIRNPNLDVGTPLGDKAAPAIKLVNQFGQPMSLSQFRGRVVMLSFEDPECTDVCPLTTQSMMLAKELLGPAGKSVQLIGIDANPDATKVANVLAYSRVHAMTNQWDFLTGSAAQLKAVWKAYDIEVEIQNGDIDHTPALYVISAQGNLEKVYLTQMAYSSVTQSAQVLAAEISQLLPSHPKLSSLGSLAAIPAQTPADPVTLPAASAARTGTAAAKVTLAPGRPRLVVFFATWLTEVSDLSSELTSLNSYVKAEKSKHLPGLTAVDETVTEPSAAAVTSYLHTLGPLRYPVALDETGRVADGYGVQDQPWLDLVNAAGKITWSHDGWVSLKTLEKAARAHP